MSKLYGTSVFLGSSVNANTIDIAEFKEYSMNLGICEQFAVFSDNSKNYGNCINSLTFVNQASNVNPDTVPNNLFPHIFRNDSVNTSVLKSAIFLDNSINRGSITERAVFALSSINEGTITETGNVIFLDNSKNNGTVLGQAQILNNSNVQNTGVISTSSVLPGIADGTYVYGNFKNSIRTTTFYPVKPERIYNFWFTFDENGYSSLANGEYNTGETNQTTYFENGIEKIQPKSYKKNGLYSNGKFLEGVEITNYFSPGGTPQQAIDTFLFYSYYGDMIRLARDGYSNGYYNSGKKIQLTSNLLDAPILAKDDGKFYLYRDGFAELVSGPYSNGFFDQGKVVVGFNNTTPVSTTNSTGNWVLYKNGWNPTLVNGAYTNGVFSLGRRQNISVGPLTAIDDVNTFYRYILGDSVKAQGAFVNGYYDEGRMFGTFTVPQTAQDQSTTWLTYNEGIPSLGNGPYTIGYFIQGKKEGTFVVPITALNENTTYFEYLSGESSIAQGSYSNGYFVDGKIASKYTNATRVSAKDNGLLYGYENGYPVLVPGTFWYSVCSTDWYDLRNWYINAERTVTANSLPTSTSIVTVIPGSRMPIVDIDDAKWVEPVQINVGRSGITFVSITNKEVSCEILGSPIIFK